MTPDLISLVGQSLMFRFEGPEFTQAHRDAFNRTRPGGVLYFGDNITSKQQIHDLSAQLQEAAYEEGLPPLFIAADQEGGIVTRLPADMVTVPSPMALGALPEELIRESARINARQLLEVGIDTNYAPSADINNNPRNPVIRTRSFGESPEVVSKAVLATMAGHLDEGVIPTVKHFPGHGNTQIDSHDGLPEIHSSIEELHAMELVPFQAAIDAGVPMVMTGHLRFPALDDLPATLSHRILTGLLREEMGFEGVIVTDSMKMDAIAAGWGLAELAVLAKAAGVDVLESSEGHDAVVARHNVLMKAIGAGRLSTEIFEATAKRLDDLRTRFRIGNVQPAMSDTSIAMKAAQRIARAGIRTASGNPVPHIPDSPSTVVIAFARLRNLEVVDRLALPIVMEEAIATNLPQARMLTLSSDPTDDDLANAHKLVASAQALVICTRDAIQHEDQRELGRQLMTAAPASSQRIHVNLRGPYDAGLLGEVDETVFTFGDAVVSLRALAEVLAGK